MAIDVKEITEKQRLSILTKREGHFFDGKALEVKPSKVSEAIAAFANTDGASCLSAWIRTKRRVLSLGGDSRMLKLPMRTYKCLIVSFH